MHSRTFVPDDSISLFVKSIMTFHESDEKKESVLPFYADGYPGIMFHATPKGLFVLPQNKKMPDLFLYGQTIRPIELKIEGAYAFIVFQLYPFVIESFFSVRPAELNDDCYDLTLLKDHNISSMVNELKNSTDFDKWSTILTSFLFSVFQLKKKTLDQTILHAVNLILDDNGLRSVSEIREELHLTERTFERRFAAQTGITPKQFSMMIQFQHSLKNITDKDYSILTDVVYKNGFADQSHFIRVFKAFTGKTPGRFNRDSI